MKESPKPLIHYVREAAGLTLGEFCAKFQHPVLLWPQGRNWTEDTDFQFETFSAEFMEEEPQSRLSERASQVQETLVLEIKKREGASPTRMICLGRAANNDIVIPNSTVSKLHAYFQHNATGNDFEVVDANSTNGTKVNGTLQSPYRGCTLINRDQIQFGPKVQVMYLTQKGFYQLLQQLYRSGIV